MKEFPKVIRFDNYYTIQCAENAPSYMQRRWVFNASDRPLSPQEIVIIALCNRIMND